MKEIRNDRSIPKLKKKAQTSKAKTIVGPIFCENQNKQSTVDVEKVQMDKRTNARMSRNG